MHPLTEELAKGRSCERCRNLRSDPQITVLIRGEGDPYRYAETRGRVERTTMGDEARAQIDEVAHQ